MMTARWLMLWLSSAGILLGMTLLLLFIEYFAVPQFLTGAFQPAKCKIVGFRFVHFKNSPACNHTTDDGVKHIDNTTDKMPNPHVSPTRSTFSSVITYSGYLDLEHNTSVSNEQHIGNNSAHEESNCLHVSAFNYMKCIEQSSGYFAQPNKSKTESGSPFLEQSESSSLGATHRERTENETNVFPNGTAETQHGLSPVNPNKTSNIDTSDVSKETSNIPSKEKVENISETVSNSTESFRVSKELQTFSTNKDNSPFLQDITTEATIAPFSQNSEDKNNLIKGSKSMSRTNQSGELSEVVQFSASNKSDHLHPTAMKNDSVACNVAQQCAVLDVSIDEKNPTCFSFCTEFTNIQSIWSLNL